MSTRSETDAIRQSEWSGRCTGTWEKAGRGGGGGGGEGRFEMGVGEVHKDMASVTVHTATYHEYVHLVRTM